MSRRRIINLKKSDKPLPNQKYICLSFIEPIFDEIKKYSFDLIHSYITNNYKDFSKIIVNKLTEKFIKDKQITQSSEVAGDNEILQYHNTFVKYLKFRTKFASSIKEELEDPENPGTQKNKAISEAESPGEAESSGEAEGADADGEGEDEAEGAEEAKGDDAKSAKKRKKGKYDIFIKFRGAYQSLKQASRCANQIKNGTSNVQVCESGTWVPVMSRGDSVSKIESRLNYTMWQNRAMQIYWADHFEQRKKDMLGGVSLSKTIKGISSLTVKEKDGKYMIPDTQKLNELILRDTYISLVPKRANGKTILQCLTPSEPWKTDILTKETIADKRQSYYCLETIFPSSADILQLESAIMREFMRDRTVKLIKNIIATFCSGASINCADVLTECGLMVVAENDKNNFKGDVWGDSKRRAEKNMFIAEIKKFINDFTSKIVLTQFPKDESAFIRGIKLRGVFNTSAQAKKYTRDVLKTKDKSANTAIARGFSWIQFNPPDEYIQSQYSANKQYNKLMWERQKGKNHTEEFKTERKEEEITDVVRGASSAPSSSPSASSSATTSSTPSTTTSTTTSSSITTLPSASSTSASSAPLAQSADDKMTDEEIKKIIEKLKR